MTGSRRRASGYYDSTFSLIEAYKLVLKKHPLFYSLDIKTSDKEWFSAFTLLQLAYLHLIDSGSAIAFLLYEYPNQLTQFVYDFLNWIQRERQKGIEFSQFFPQDGKIAAKVAPEQAVAEISVHGSASIPSRVDPDGTATFTTQSSSSLSSSSSSSSQSSSALSSTTPFVSTSPSSRTKSLSSSSPPLIRSLSFSQQQSEFCKKLELKWQQYRRFQYHRPVAGTVILNKTMDKVLLGSIWVTNSRCYQTHFARGQILPNETPLLAAIRHTQQRFGNRNLIQIENCINPQEYVTYLRAYRGEKQQSMSSKAQSYQQSFNDKMIKELSAKPLDEEQIEAMESYNDHLQKKSSKIISDNGYNHDGVIVHIDGPADDRQAIINAENEYAQSFNNLKKNTFSKHGSVSDVDDSILPDTTMYIVVSDMTGEEVFDPPIERNPNRNQLCYDYDQFTSLEWYDLYDHNLLHRNPLLTDALYFCLLWAQQHLRRAAMQHQKGKTSAVALLNKRAFENSKNRKKLVQSALNNNSINHHDDDGDNNNNNNTSSQYIQNQTPIQSLNSLDDPASLSNNLDGINNSNNDHIDSLLDDLIDPQLDLTSLGRISTSLSSLYAPQSSPNDQINQNPPVPKQAMYPLKNLIGTVGSLATNVAFYIPMANLSAPLVQTSQNPPTFSVTFRVGSDRAYQWTGADYLAELLRHDLINKPRLGGFINENHKMVLSSYLNSSGQNILNQNGQFNPLNQQFAGSLQNQSNHNTNNNTNNNTNTSLHLNRLSALNDDKDRQSNPSFSRSNSPHNNNHNNNRPHNNNTNTNNCPKNQSQNIKTTSPNKYHLNNNPPSLKNTPSDVSVNQLCQNRDSYNNSNNNTNMKNNYLSPNFQHSQSQHHVKDNSTPKNNHRFMNNQNNHNNNSDGFINNLNNPNNNSRNQRNNNPNNPNNNNRDIDGSNMKNYHNHRHKNNNTKLNSHHNHNNSNINNHNNNNNNHHNNGTHDNDKEGNLHHQPQQNIFQQPQQQQNNYFPSPQSQYRPLTQNLHQNSIENGFESHNIGNFSHNIDNNNNFQYNDPIHKNNNNHNYSPPHSPPIHHQMSQSSQPMIQNAHQLQRNHHHQQQQQQQQQLHQSMSSILPLQTHLSSQHAPQITQIIPTLSSSSSFQQQQQQQQLQNNAFSTPSLYLHNHIPAAGSPQPNGHVLNTNNNINNINNNNNIPLLQPPFYPTHHAQIDHHYLNLAFQDNQSPSSNNNSQQYQYGR